MTATGLNPDGSTAFQDGDSSGTLLELTSRPPEHPEASAIQPDVLTESLLQSLIAATTTNPSAALGAEETGRAEITSSKGSGPPPLLNDEDFNQIGLQVLALDQSISDLSGQIPGLVKDVGLRLRLEATSAEQQEDALSGLSSGGLGGLPASVVDDNLSPLLAGAYAGDQVLVFRGDLEPATAKAMATADSPEPPAATGLSASSVAPLRLVVQEDRPLHLGLQELLADSSGYGPFQITDSRTGATITWLSASSRRGDAELSGRVVIETDWQVPLGDPASPDQLSSLPAGTELRLNLLVSDNRNNGRGLLGIDGDLRWNRQAATVLAIDLNDTLPLFRSTGSSSWIAGSATLVAAALPLAGAGEALGDQRRERFAQVTLRLEDPSQPLDLTFTPRLYPAVGTQAVTGEELLNLGLHRPPQPVLEGQADQAQVGTHTLQLQSTTPSGESWQRELLLEVQNSNDAPQTVPGNTSTSLFRQRPFQWAIAGLFRDDDLPLGDRLRYSLVPGAEPLPWLSLDPDSGILNGTPPPGPAGPVHVQVQASDRAGASISQTLQLLLEPLNHPPEPNPAVAWPELQLDENTELAWSLPAASFLDADGTAALRYSLAEPLPWLSIDASSGELRLSPDATAVGEHSLRIIATDPRNESAERQLRLVVANLNEAPRLDPEAIEAFRRRHGPVLQVLEDQPLPLDPFTEGAWFRDPDLQLPGAYRDQLTYSAQLSRQQADGSLLPIAAAWLQVDPGTGVLQISAGNGDVGLYRLRLSARDREGLAITTSLPLEVLNVNDAPWVAPEVASSFSAIALAEDQPFRISLPGGLFVEDDAGDALSFEIRLASGAALPAWIHFDADIQRLAGIASSDLAALDLVITARDRHGASADHPLQLLLPRRVEPPLVQTRTVHRREGEALQLLEALQAEVADPDSESLRYRIALRDVPERWQLVSLLGPLPAAIDGVLELHDLTAVQLVNGDGGASGRVALSLEVISQERDGSRALQEVELSFEVAPMVAPPLLAAAATTAPIDPFNPQPLASIATAQPLDGDGSEVISRYVLTYRPSSSHPAATDLQVLDAQGTALGRWSVRRFSEGGDQWQLSLSAEEWNRAILTSGERLVGEEVRFSVVAYALETASGEEAGSSQLELRLPVTPQVLPPSLQVLDTTARISINDGDGHERARFHFSAEGATSRDHTALLVRLSDDVTLLPGEAAISISDPGLPPPAPGQRLLLVQGEGLADLSLELLPAEGFRGPLTLSVQSLASARPQPSGRFEALSDDLQRGFSALGEAIDLALQVVPRARPPRLENLRFDPNSGELLFELRRGSSRSGRVNGAEQITLTISGLPEGYGLVLPEGSNGLERRAGAADAFATAVLFSLPPQDGDAQAADAAIALPLRLRSLASADQPPQPFEAATLRLEAMALLPADDDLPSGDRSVTVSASLSIGPWIGPRQTLALDPLIIDLDGDGLALSSLETSDSAFDLLNDGRDRRSGWLAPGEPMGDDALLVLDRDGDGEIRSSAELLSELFGSSNQRRTFASGIAALASLDGNRDGHLDASDAAWSSLQLWFDNGDGQSRPEELHPLSAHLSRLDLSATPLSARTASANPLLRQATATQLDGGSAPLFDVGLRFDPTPMAIGQDPGAVPRLQLEAALAAGATLEEGGDPVTLRLLAPALDPLSTDEANLTLVRISGLPAGLIPNLGLQDSRGDWLFTWADLQNARAQGRDLTVQSIDHRSGSANAAVLVTRIGGDGSVLASAITPVAIDVRPVADRPQLLVRRLQGLEDTPIPLEQLVRNGGATLIDGDGSEQLSYRISGLPAGVQLLQRLASGALAPLALEPDPEQAGAGGSQRLVSPLLSLADVLLVPPPDQAGRIELTITAIASEGANGGSAAISRTASVLLAAVVDPPRLSLDPALAANGLVLQEQGSIDLSGIQASLIDRDGSEELFVELAGLPDWVRLERADNPNWRPELQISSGNGSRMVRVRGSDLGSGQLRLRDVISASVSSASPASAPGSLRKDDFSLEVVALSQEVSNGQLSVDQTTLQSEPQRLSVLFSSQAHRPLLQLNGDLQIWEDDSTPLPLRSVLQVSLSPEARRELLQIELRGLPPGLELRQRSGAALTPERWQSGAAVHRLSSLDDLELVATTPQLSVRIPLTVEAISRSSTGAGEASTGPRTFWLTIQPVADRPVLQAPSAWWVDAEGRVPLEGLQLSSADDDGSERLSLVLFGVPAAAQLLGPARAIRAPGADGQLQDGWEIAASDLARVQLLLPPEHPDLELQLRARSRELEGGARSEAWSDPAPLTVLAGARAVVPQLEVSGSLIGDEDTPIPLLSDEGGVISAALVGRQAQRLQFRLHDLPEGATLRRREQGRWQILAADSPGSGTYSLNSLAGVALQLAADANGLHRFQVEAIATALRSSDQRRSSQEVILQVRAINDAPRPLGGSDLSLQEGEVRLVSLAERFSDPDAGDQLRYGLEGDPLPAWITLDPASGQLRLQPDGSAATGDGQPLTLTITATDRGGRQSRQLLRVAVGNVNQAPLNNPDQSAERHLAQGQPWSLDLTTLFLDPDQPLGDRLRISLEDPPSWLQLLDTGILSGTPGNDDVGPRRLQLSATDSGGLQARRELMLTIENRNDPPALGPGFVSGEVQRLRQGEPLHLDLSGLFVDADSRYGDSLQISSTSNRGSWPGWLRWDARSGVLGGTPGNDDVGDVRITWTASDGESQVRYERTFSVENVNDAPFARSLPPQQLEQDQLIALDLSDLIRDPDFGDHLRYDLTVEDLNGRPIDSSDWLTLRDRQTLEQPPADRLRLMTVLRDPVSGELISPEQFRTLPAGALVSLELRVHDDRQGIRQRGLLGIDLDLRWTPESLELVSRDPTELQRGLTSELPLFATVDTARLGEGRLGVRGASAPALGIGSPLGDTGDERLIQLMLRIRDPQQLALIDLQVREESMGGVGLGWIEATPGDTRVHLGSWSNAQRLELQARPHNEQVGSYTVTIRGTDASGSSASSRFRLEVSDRNEAPLVIRPLEPARFRDNRLYALPLDTTFADPDRIHGDRLSYTLEVLSGTVRADQFQISQRLGENGQAQTWLDCNVPGLTEASTVTLRIRATDRAGLESSQILSVTLEPGLDPLPVSSGLHRAGQTGKNVRFNLAESLALAPLGSGDPEDVSTLKLRLLPGADLVPAESLRLDPSQQQRWRQLWSRLREGERELWSCDLQALAEISGVPAAGLLAGIEITPPRNGGLLMGSGSVGLPLELWTETRVRGDADGRYGSERSAPVQAWLEIRNVVPSFDWWGERSLILPSLDAGELIAGAAPPPLWSLASLFPDLDRLEGDVLNLEVRLPPELQRTLRWDGENSQLLWRDQARFSPSLLGRHLIEVVGSDSHYSLGDRSALSRGTLALEFRNAAQSSLVGVVAQLQSLGAEAGGQGLQQLQQVLRGDLQPTDPSLSPERQRSLAASRSLLSSLPSLSQLLAEPESSGTVATLLPLLLNNLIHGQALTARGSSDHSDTPLFVYGQGATLSQAGLKAVNPDLMASYLNRYPAAAIQTPIDELSFEVAAPVATDLASGQPRIGFAVINLELPLGGFALNRLIKTRAVDSDGDGIDDSSRAWDLRLMPQALAADPLQGLRASSALQASLFDVVDYAGGLPDPLIRLDVSDPLAGRQLLEAVQAGLPPGESLATALKRLDGSGYLIDLNNDGRADLIRLLLLDQGFFDTIDRPGLIGDPLIPAQLEQGVVPDRGRNLSRPGDSGETGAETMPQARSALAVSSRAERDQTAATGSQVGLQAPAVDVHGQQQTQAAETNERDGPPADRVPAHSVSPIAPIGSEGDPILEQLRRTLAEIPEVLPRLADGLNSTDSSRMLVCLLIGVTLLPLLVERGIVPTIGLELEPLRLRHPARQTPWRWTLPATGGAMPMTMELVDGRLKLCDVNAGTAVRPSDQETRSLDLRADLLWHLVGGTSEPGRLVEQMEQVLKRLINGQEHDRPIDWQPWIQELSRQHRNTSTPALMRAFVSRQLVKGLQGAEREQTGLSDALMGLQVLRCYQELGGDLRRVIV